MLERIIEILLYVSVFVYVLSPVDGIPGNLDDIGVLLMGCYMFQKWQIYKFDKNFGEESDEEH